MARHTHPRRTFIPRAHSTKKRRRRKASRVACKGKVRYRDQDEALAALHLIISGDVREKTPKRTYFCEDCAGWHLSSWWSHDRAGITSLDAFDRKHRSV